MLEKLAKPLLWVLTSAFPVFIAACYGVAEDFGYNDGGTDPDASGNLHGKVVNKISQQGIGNILVTCNSSEGVVQDDTYTSQGDGSFSLIPPSPGACKTISVLDVDGEENGGKFLPITAIVTTDPAVDGGVNPNQSIIIELSQER